MNSSVKIFPTPQALAESLALDLVNQIKEDTRSSSTFMIALSGGNTTKLLFSVLGDQFTSSVIWHKVHFFWVDERCVSPEDQESNFGMTNEVLLSKIDIAKENIHRIKGEEDPVKEAVRYSKEINDFTVKRSGLPFFNVMLLGLGEDGHTASVFPGNEKLFVTDEICTTSFHPSTGQKRITITGKVINNAAKIIFIVTGKNKSMIVNNILCSGDNKEQFPASLVKPADGKLFWYLDEAAGLLLK